MEVRSGGCDLIGRHERELANTVCFSYAVCCRAFPGYFWRWGTRSDRVV